MVISLTGGYMEKDNGPWKGKKLSEEHKKNISNSLKGITTWNKNIPHSEETKKKISDSEKGKIISLETKKKMSIASKGKSKSIEHAEKCRTARIGKKSPRIICEHCKKDVATSIYARFHGNNCKHKNI